MASSILHKLLKNHKFPIKFISSLHKPKHPFLIPPLSPNLLLCDPHLEQTLSPNHSNPNLAQFRTLDSISPKSVPIFPNFPFGYCLNPILSNGSVPDSGGGAVSGEDGGMWADSVKKKRKRKMNKHKLKKLRKRLRRKTKT